MKKAVETKNPPPPFPGDIWRLSYRSQARLFAIKTLSDSELVPAEEWVDVDVLTELPDGNVLWVCLKEPVRFFISPKNFTLGFERPSIGFPGIARAMKLDHLREYAAENWWLFGECRVTQYKRPPAKITATLHEGLLRYLKAML